MKSSVASLWLVLIFSCSTARGQETFSKGSLIIPMDTTYQDQGMFKAFGLLYQLLKADIPVHWVIKSPKALGDADLTTSSTDFSSSASVPSHGYRGGPFVVSSELATAASPVIMAWQASNTTTVHIAEQDFSGRTGRLLTAAPTIAVIADKNQGIAFGYLNAAGITDRNGNVWSDTSPDVLTIEGIRGPTDTKHNDGTLFLPSGQPAFCQIMTMHWGVKEVVNEVVAEYRSFLQFPTHMMAECQAVNAIENNIYGHFITPKGFLIDNNVKETGPFSFLNLDTPFVQMDGPYNLVTGSEQAYSLPAGDAFFDLNVVMIKDQTTSVGQRSIWMTGYIDGRCSLIETEGTGGGCNAGVGKISYLGGHKYDTLLPISTHPTSQGTRLFLNSLFEAACATNEGQPEVQLIKNGPSWTTSSTVTYTLEYQNASGASVIDLVLKDSLPSGVSYVSATRGGYLDGNTVVWNLGDLPPWSVDVVELTVSFADYGSYENSFSGTYQVGLNTKEKHSNKTTTQYLDTPPPDAQAPSDGGVSPQPDGAIHDAPVIVSDGISKDIASSIDLTGDFRSRDLAAAIETSIPSGDAAIPKDGIDIVTDSTTSQIDLSQSGKKDLISSKSDGSGLHSEGKNAATGGSDGGCDCSYPSSPFGSGWLIILLAVLFLGNRGVRSLRKRR
jgi:uncharacterized repeat protein (TIGR01451 family)